MSNATWSFVLGAFFIFLGIGFFLWGRKETSDYEAGLASRYDLRELMEHTPERPEPGALKIGGIIGLALGVGLVVAGFFLI
jgi:hypothetical protein